ncbi:hypothetical protein PHLCEN_2v10512 [Hermanssonia centrifuga]|uniref:Uncharacterized protein n=1 Tax=Hermanssonia centrifuga TaxID=98765 RepID=A0A2R6NMG7_9APHY|nr:hypothetical protein PHLCEN_2v10512 [Hermanssonia centrifuga]
MSMLVRASLRQVAARRFAAPSRGVHGEYNAKIIRSGLVLWDTTYTLNIDLEVSSH